MPVSPTRSKKRHPFHSTLHIFTSEQPNYQFAPIISLRYRSEAISRGYDYVINANNGCLKFLLETLLNINMFSRPCVLWDLCKMEHTPEIKRELFVVILVRLTEPLFGK